MALEYRVNPELDVPIYTQLIDMIRSDIVNNKLSYGVKLPTVRDFSDACGIARGTVMRAYSELEQQGYLEKIQGRGTFVSYKEGTHSSRKDAAMAAIDAMLDTLDSLNFSAAEAEIYLDLKLRERYAGRCDVSVAVVDSCPETLSPVVEQLRGIGGLEVDAYQLEDILSYPYKITSETDLVVVPRESYDALAEVFPDTGKLARFVPCLTEETLSAIARIPAGDRIGILTRSEAFGELLESACRICAPGAVADSPRRLPETDRSFLRGKNVLLVPEEHERFCDGSTAELLTAFGTSGTMIPCRSAMDAGSFLYIADRIDSIREKKHRS